MTKNDMINIIQSSKKENVWALIEADTNAFTRFTKRHFFFEALKDLQVDRWED